MSAGPVDGGFLGAPAAGRRASEQVAVLPVPYDATSSWVKGADRGPAAIIAASHQVEWHDIQTGTSVHERGIEPLDPRG